MIDFKPITLQEQEHRLHILSYRGGIAPWSIGPAYVVSSTIGRVDVVVANGGSGHKAHGWALEQLLIYTRTRAHEERIGMTHSLRSDSLWCEIQDLEMGRKDAIEERYALVDDDAHFLNYEWWAFFSDELWVMS